MAGGKFLESGIGPNGNGAIIIRSGSLGAYVATREHGGRWVDAFWTPDEQDASKIVDVTGGSDLLYRSRSRSTILLAGAGNSFLGGLGAGLQKAKGDVYEGGYMESSSAEMPR